MYLPYYTKAQSQSCIYLRMNLTTSEFHLQQENDLVLAKLEYRSHIYIKKTPGEITGGIKYKSEKNQISPGCL